MRRYWAILYAKTPPFDTFFEHFFLTNNGSFGILLKNSDFLEYDCYTVRLDPGRVNVKNWRNECLSNLIQP